MGQRASKFVSANSHRNPISSVQNLHRFLSVNEMSRIESEAERFSVWGEPRLCLRDVTDSEFRFQLRSRVNTSILCGGPLPHGGDVFEAASRVLERCADDSALRIDDQRRSYRVSLIDVDGNVLGQSETMETEALARAMIRLIVVQARNATVALFDGDRLPVPVAE